MKQNFLSMMKHSMMAIFSVVAMGMMTASLAACSSSEDESEKEAAKVKANARIAERNTSKAKGIFCVNLA